MLLLLLLLFFLLHGVLVDDAIHPVVDHAPMLQPLRRGRACATPVATHVQF
jgi:hypothetical protein